MIYRVRFVVLQLHDWESSYVVRLIFEVFDIQFSKIFTYRDSIPEQISHFCQNRTDVCRS